MDVQVLKEIALFLNPVLLAVCAYFLISLHKDWKQEKKERKEKDEAQDKKIAQVERDFMSFKASLPEKYTLKDDFIREISKLEYTLEQINKNILILVNGKRTNGSES